RTAFLTICLALATGCHGNGSRNELVLNAVGATHAHDLDVVGSILRRRIDLLGIRDASMRLRPAGRITIRTRRPIPAWQRQTRTKAGSLGFYDLEADLAPPSLSGGEPRATPDPFRLLEKVRAQAGGSSPSAFL